METGHIKLKKLLAELEQKKGRHTELVSVYIPAGFSLNEINSLIANEISLTQNVKSKAVRKNVIAALTKIQQHLKLYRQTPAHGLAIFCGNIAEQEGQTDIRIWAIEPPEPLTVKMYWCDQRFELEPLRSQLKEKEVYGLVVLDTKEATLGLLKGKSIQTLWHDTSIVPGKFIKGGQCVIEDTIVEKSDCRKIKIKDLKENDIIKAFDFKKNKIVNSKCEKIFKRNSKKAYEIITKNKLIIATGEHLFFTDGAKEKYVEDLKVGDELLTVNGKEKIIKINKIKLNGFFYDLVVPEYQNFIANGLIVHNSAQRFQRVREGLVNDWYKEIAENVKKHFFGQELKGILLGGPGMSKEDFYNSGVLETDMKNKILGLQNVGYTDEHGLEELVNRSSELLKEAAVAKEKELCNKFLNELQKDSGKVTYGIALVLKALEAGSVELILLSEGFEFEEVELLCSCGFSEKKFVKSTEKEKVTCSKCGGRPHTVGEQDGLDAIEEKAKQYGTKVEIISRETREGEQLFALGGIGAFLRWKI